MLIIVQFAALIFALHVGENGAIVFSQHSNKNFQKMLTIEELKDEFPSCFKTTGWTSQDIGIFVSTGLLKGTYIRNKQKTLVDKDSFKNLLVYYNTLCEGRKVKL